MLFGWFYGENIDVFGGDRQKMLRSAKIWREFNIVDWVDARP